MSELPVVVIPSLEPDSRLPAYIRQLQDSGFDRIVVVDDGSGEKWQPIFQQVRDLGCAVLRHPANRGKGAALKTAYTHIAAAWPDAMGVLTADSDGQHTAPDCLKLAKALLSGEDALWLGSRDFSLEHVPPKSRFGNRITSAVFRLFYGVWLPDTQTGLRAFRMAELPFMSGIPGDRYEYEMNVLIACARRKLPMKPITIETVYENGNEGTHFHPIRDSWRIYSVILGSFFKFIASSLFCFAIDQLLAWLLRDVLLGGLGAAATFIGGYGARAVSAVINFLLNKNLVFRQGGDSKRQALRYLIVAVAIITLSNLGVEALAALGMAKWLGKMLCDLLLYFVSYNVQSRWVFAPEKEA